MVKERQIRLFFGDERAIITWMCRIRGTPMKRWYFALSTVLLVNAPLVSFAQTGNFSGTGTGTGQGNLGGGQGTGLAGQVNTTLLGSSVNLNFSSVFGSNATLANTNTDPFSAYRPSGSGTGSSTGTGGIGNAFAGGGMTNSGTGANRSGTGNLGTNNFNTNRTGTGLGTAGGGFTGGALGGNRTTTFGGGMTGQQRMGMLGGNMGGLLGGTGFLGGGGMGMNNQQGSSPALGYQVNYNGQPVNNITSTVTPSTELQQRLSASPGMQGVSNLKVFMQGDTAILRGAVTSDYAKQLAAAMVRLEPGVYHVENELVVAPAKP